MEAFVNNIRLLLIYKFLEVLARISRRIEFQKKVMSSGQTWQIAPFTVPRFVLACSVLRACRKIIYAISKERSEIRSSIDCVFLTAEGDTCVIYLPTTTKLEHSFNSWIVISHYNGFNVDKDGYMALDLLLGMPFQKHEGLVLADSMLFWSKLALFSLASALPRYVHLNGLAIVLLKYSTNARTLSFRSFDGIKAGPPEQLPD